MVHFLGFACVVLVREGGLKDEMNQYVAVRSHVGVSVLTLIPPQLKSTQIMPNHSPKTKQNSLNPQWSCLHSTNPPKKCLRKPKAPVIGSFSRPVWA